MKKILLFLSACMAAGAMTLSAEEEENLNNVNIYDHVVFYDGYRMYDNPDSLVDDGILRHSCSLYSRKLTEEQLNALGKTLNLNVFVTACCDNYDRIGNINIAFVPKGAETYSVNDVSRIEIARFITPFMDMNKEPSTVPYKYNMDYMSLILRDRELREKYDLWLEYELFGVPYAANEQIAGCAGRSDVFKGTLDFETDEPAEMTEGNVLVPIVIKKPEYIGSNLNNYNEEGTDTIGKTTKTYIFDVPKDVNDAQIVLITSNHGANNNGEEYKRRWHYIYYDDELVLTYKPGRESCEPFRVYNTQANGIYGWVSKSDEEWQSFSNWCPGDVIDNRIIHLGAVKAGEHKIRISVPNARFVGKYGDIPVSMYFHGVTEGAIDAGVSFPVAPSPLFRVTVDSGYVKMSGEASVERVEVYTVLGERIHIQKNTNPIPLSEIKEGICLFNIELENGIIETHKVMIRK